VWNAVFSGNDGIAWIRSLIVAIVLIVLYERMVAKRDPGTAQRQPLVRRLPGLVACHPSASSPVG
jgi:hypothetical protein